MIPVRKDKRNLISHKWQSGAENLDSMITLLYLPKVNNDVMITQAQACKFVTNIIGWDRPQYTIRGTIRYSLNIHLFPYSYLFYLLKKKKRLTKLKARIFLLTLKFGVVPKV